MKSLEKLFTTCITASLLLVTFARSQDPQFGKNKVQYKNFDWNYIQTSHFDIYFDTGTVEIANFAADVAESSYYSISKSFRYQIRKRVPVIVYSSHNAFQQTNVISEYLEEGIGGVTELFKNRVVVPFEGDYKKFRHVIHHELVHAVMNDMFYGGSIQSIITNNISLRLPLWFSEGLAEYESLKWDTDSDMFLRDATVHEYLPKIDQLYGYFAYRGGQSVWKYIVNKYGEQKISEILSRIRGSRSVDLGFRGAVGLSIEELSEKWQKEQKKLYWPDIAKRQEPADFAKKLTDHTKDGSFYNTSPAISPQGDRIAFISNRDDYFDVFIMNAIDGKIVKKLIHGQRTPDFEELHLLTPGISWSPDGERVALATKSGARDAIMLVDAKSGSSEKIDPGLDGIFSVQWSPSNSGSGSRTGKLAFVGINKNHSDIYVYDLDARKLTNLTNDIFTDSDPAWSADGSELFFSSDRRDHLTPSSTPADFKMQSYDYSQRDLYSVEIGSLQIKRITDLPGSDESSPAAGRDGKHLFFISDMNGINNIYVKDLARDSIYARTNSLSGVYQLSVSGNGNKLAFSSLHNAGFDIFLMRGPLENGLLSVPIEPTEFLSRLTAVDLHADSVTVKRSELFLDDNVVVMLDQEDSTEFFPSEEKADLRNYVFSDAFKRTTERQFDTAGVPPITDNRDEKGNYRINKYKLNFSPDIVYGNAGYNTLYGVQGSTIIAFSDMLGDHQIFALVDLIFDLKNSDYALAYLYLPRRIDYGVQGFHSVRFLSLSGADGPDNYMTYRFRNYGATLMAQYPVSKFNRVEFNLAWLNITRDNMDIVSESVQRRTLITPSLSYIHDTSLWGLIAPANGERYNLSALASPRLNDRSLGFVTLTGDYRRYLKLWKNYTLTIRLAAGASYGKDPQRFIIGGVDNWINRRFENNQIPVERPEDFVFMTSGLPLRGYNYGARMGTKYALSNTELRFPFFGYFSAGPLPVFLQSFSGVLFLDMGAAWYWGSDFQAFAKDQNNNLYLRDILPGTGYGLRMILLGFLLKMDVAWSFDLRNFSTPRYYFSLGADI